MLDYLANHIYIAFLLIILSVAFVLIINGLLFYWHIKTAIRKFVKPELEQKCLKYVGYKLTGFWGSGDFKDQIEFAPFKTGLNTTSVYSYVYYKSDGIIKRVTIKIYLINLMIDKVVYSDDIK